MKPVPLRLIPWAAGLLLLASPALAQETSRVTFQVDLSTAIERCAFDPEDPDAYISVRGSFNDWGARDADYKLADPDGDGVYVGTFDVPRGEIQYKFWGTGNVGWEDNIAPDQDNRIATVGPQDLTLEVVPFNKTFPNLCAGPNYLLFFEVDMSIQELLGNFDPQTDQLYVQGDFQGWQNFSPDWRLSESPFEAGIFTGEFQVALEVGQTYNYKFAFRSPTEGDTWESGPNRNFRPTGEEEIDDETGLRLLRISRFFDDITPADVLDEPATVRFEVDLRPAFYYLADNGRLPADTQTGEPVTSISGLFINGPVARASNEDSGVDWATWGPSGLGQIETRRLRPVNDPVLGDSLFAITYTYPAGTPRRLIGKYGIDGYDNEGGFGADHVFRIRPGTQTIRTNYGCILQSDGTYSNTSGPSIGDQDFSRAWEPYLVVDNQAQPPTCTVVRRAGATSVEPTGRTPEAFVLHANYPNPASGMTTFEYGLTTTAHVRLEVFDLMGRRVATVVDAVQAPDTYRVWFDASTLAPGTYFYRLSAGDRAATQRMTVVR